MKRRGMVVSVNGDNAHVIILDHEECKGCGACKNGNRKIDFTMEANNSIGARVGQKVEIELSGKNFITAGFITYVIPLTALFIGVFIGHRFKNELISALMGLLFLMAAFTVIHFYDGIFKNCLSKPIIIEVCDEGE